MHIKSILSAAAIALAATIGSASAADQFTTLDGITAQALTPQEMGVVIGADELTVMVTPTPGLATLPAAHPVGRHDKTDPGGSAAAAFVVKAGRNH